MAVKIMITIEMEKRLRRMVTTDGFENHEEHGNFSATTARKLISSIEDAKARKEVVKGLSPQEAIRVIRSVLGSSAALPPTQTPAFYGFIKQRINFLGLTAEDVEKAAIRAKHTYRLPTSVHYIMTTIDRLVGEDWEPPGSNVVVVVKTGREDEEA